LWTALGIALLLGLSGACRRTEAPSKPPPSNLPTLRLYVLSNLAGALEPCGCVKDMLGGVDHAAAFVAAGRGEAQAALVLAAGPLLFMDPELPDGEARTQELWKAETIAGALRDIGLAAWAPGHNDWAAGAEQLSRLEQQAGAKVLAGNLQHAPVAESFEIKELGGIRVAVVGLSMPEHAGRLPEGVKAEAVLPAAKRAIEKLDRAKAQIRILLVALPRGEALRLAEAVTGFDVLLVGRPVETGEANDAAVPPVLVGQTLVVQPPNHLQAVAVVDLHVRDGDPTFEDGSGITHREQREGLDRRIAELERRIGEWAKRGDVSPQDLEARRADLLELKTQRKRLETVKTPETGSFFRYRLQPIRESLGVDAQVARRMKAYYRRVNEHNRVALKDRTPPEPEPGQSRFVGVEACTACHVEERAFWNTTRHAKAYATLETQHKQFNLNCVGCHVTGYEEPGGSTVTHVENLQNVQCETCHGPGSRHVADPKNAALIVAKPARDLCGPKCHHPPHVEPSWDVHAAWSQIIGPGHGG